MAGVHRRGRSDCRDSRLRRPRRGRASGHCMSDPGIADGSYVVRRLGKCPSGPDRAADKLTFVISTPTAAVRLLVAVGAMLGMLVISGTASASSVSALARIRDTVHLTETNGSAHFVKDVWVSGAGPSQHIASIGDLQFPGPNVSLAIRVTSSSSSDSPLSHQIAIGKNFYTRYVSPSGAPAPWSKGITRQPYPYLGAVESAALTNFRGPVKIVGTNIVSGHPAIEYALSIPAENRILPLPGSKTQRLTIKSFTLDVWLNRTGEIVCTSASQVTEDNGTTVRSRTMVTLSRFGEPVHIAAPTHLATP